MMMELLAVLSIQKAWQLHLLCSTSVNDVLGTTQFKFYLKTKIITRLLITSRASNKHVSNFFRDGFIENVFVSKILLCGPQLRARVSAELNLEF